MTLGFALGTHALPDRLEAHLNGTPLPNCMTRYEEVNLRPGRQRDDTVLHDRQTA